MYKVITYLAIGVLIGYGLSTYIHEPIEVIKAEGDTWCWYAEYASLKDYVLRKPRSLIEYQGEKVHVWTPCDT